MFCIKNKSNDISEALHGAQCWGLGRGQEALGYGSLENQLNFRVESIS